MLKQKSKKFMEDKKRINKFVTDLQIIEFLHAYLKGTKVCPYDHFLERSPEDTFQEMELENAPVAGATSVGSTEF